MESKFNFHAVQMCYDILQYIYDKQVYTFSRNFLFLQYSSLTFFHDMFRPPRAIIR
jgi:hypothetical protein